MPNYKHKWPKRMRCVKCSRIFAFLVLDGLYCSYKCAEHPDPFTISKDKWPRKHFHWDYSTQNSESRTNIKEKRLYFSKEEAERGKKSKENVYYCDFCLTWHRGTSADNRDPRSPRSSRVALPAQRSSKITGLCPYWGGYLGDLGSDWTSGCFRRSEACSPISEDYEI